MREYFLWLLKLATLMVLFLVVVPVLLALSAAAISGVAVGLEGTGKNSVAVIELKGEIEDTKEVVSQLHKQAYDKSVEGIVLRIDSPGGGVGASQDVNNAVKSLKARKPIVASMGGVAASGGLYSAVSASKVFAEPGTLTGSIGVIMQAPNFTQLANWAKVDVITIKSGRLKDLGNPFREMAPEERQFLEATLAATHDEFITAVAEGRNIPRTEVLKFADGRILTGAQAKELKLVDSFGTIYDAARAVFELKGKPLGADELPTLVYPVGRFAHLKDLVGTVSAFTKYFSRAPQMKYLL